MLKVGDEVVCVDDKVGFEQWLGIRAGEVYTIRWIGQYSHYIHGDYLGVRLAGVERMDCPHFGYKDVPFAASRFKPVVKPRTVRELEECV